MMTVKVNINGTVNEHGEKLEGALVNWAQSHPAAFIFLSIQTHILHELAADGADLLAQRGTEHHDLLLVRGHLEDFLDVASHVCSEKQKMYVHRILRKATDGFTVPSFFNPLSRSASSFTQLFQHFVALVQHKVFDVLQVEDLAVDQCQSATGCSHHNVWAVLLQHLLVFFYSHATKEHRHLDTRHVLGEALVLFADLEGQFSGVAHDKYRHLEEKNQH